jgi:hypothetical protein
VDVPVGETRGFVFTPHGHQGPRVVRTLRQFVAELEHRQDLDGYLRRGDVSRWIADVFGDHALAAELRELEATYREAPTTETVPAIVAAIRARYDLGA